MVTGVCSGWKGQVNFLCVRLQRTCVRQGQVSWTRISNLMGHCTFARLVVHARLNLCWANNTFIFQDLAKEVFFCSCERAQVRNDESPVDCKFCNLRSTAPPLLLQRRGCSSPFPPSSSPLFLVPRSCPVLRRPEQPRRRRPFSLSISFPPFPPSSSPSWI